MWSKFLAELQNTKNEKCTNMQTFKKVVNQIIAGYFTFVTL